MANNQLQSIKARFGIVGTSKLLDNALEIAVRVAPTDLSVLINGESGVGKEVFSKIIHSLSSRKHNDFIAVNCGAIPEGTINSELFGHEKGSFTGAVGERKGYFESVNGGTIFLDEIGEMPLDTQAYLLRLLENGEYIKVGSSKVEKTDVRVIAATNVNLQDRVANGKFREDLFYRLSIVPIKVPALHERREDISLLFRKFAYDFAEKYRMQPVRLDPQAEMILESYRWPGNIRELKNVAEQLSVMSEERQIIPQILTQLMPQLLNRSLPVLSGGRGGSSGSEFQERELLYKVLFEMKNDLNDLKSLVFELVKSNDLRMPEVGAMRSLPTANTLRYRESEMASDGYTEDEYRNISDSNPFSVRPADSSGTRIFIEPGRHNNGGPSTQSFDKSEIEETPLAMEEIEKDAIRRSLKKYNGRRKEAAEELKISERTLYRKIKQYDL